MTVRNACFKTYDTILWHDIHALLHQGLWIIRLAQLLINSSTLHARPGLPVPPPCIFAVGNKIGYITLCGRAIKQVRVQVSRISVEQLFINNWCNLLFQEHLAAELNFDTRESVSRWCTKGLKSVTRLPVRVRNLSKADK